MVVFRGQIVNLWVVCANPGRSKRVFSGGRLSPAGQVGFGIMMRFSAGVVGDDESVPETCLDQLPGVRSLVFPVN